MLNKSIAFAALTCLLAAPSLAQKKYDTGASDGEIKLGHSVPYSGPASAFGIHGRVTLAYARMLNEQGGINGRKISFTSLDNGFLPPKALEVSRQLVESIGVFAEVGTLGTPPNLAIRPYLNAKHVPQLFVFSGISKMDDPEHYPWTVPWYTRFEFEAIAYARYLIQNKPEARIALLWQNDDFGKDYVTGFRRALGDKSTMIVSDASFDLTDPTVDSQIIALKASGADTLIVFGTPKFGAQALRKTADLRWDALRILCAPASGIEGVLRPAGLEISKGVLTSQILKDPDDAEFAAAPDVKDYLAFMQKWAPQENPRDSTAIASFVISQAMEYVLKKAGDELTRENVLKQATTLDNLKLKMLLPGVALRNSPAGYTAFRQYVMSRFDGRSWKPFGPVYSAD